MEKVTDFLTINVGGQLFYTTQDTLNRSPFFEALLVGVGAKSRLKANTLETKATEETEKKAEPFIDRDPKAFKHVLALLRDPGYAFPAKFWRELDFFGIDHELTTSMKPYYLPSDLMHFRFDERKKLGPVQVASVQDAPQLTEYDEYGIRVLFSSKAYDAITQAGFHDFFGDSLEKNFWWFEGTRVFVQVTETQFRCYTMSQLTKDRKILKKDPNDPLPIWAIPVVDNLSGHNHKCDALLIVTAFHFFRFQTLPSGATLEVCNFTRDIVQKDKSRW